MLAQASGETRSRWLRWPVVSVEIDPEIIEILRYNIQVYGVQDKVEIIQGDTIKLVKDGGFKSRLDKLDVIFFDPSRRGEGGRTVKTEEYIPSLSFIDELLKLCPNLCVKISPGTDLDRIKYDCDIEVISNRGEAKERGPLVRQTETGSREKGSASHEAAREEDYGKSNNRECRGLTGEKLSF